MHLHPAALVRFDEVRLGEVAEKALGGVVVDVQQCRRGGPVHILARMQGKQTERPRHR
jgi:hypothetical protein